MESERETNLVEQSQPVNLAKDKMQTDDSQEEENSGSQQSSSPSCFDELISPGGQHFTFGTFKEMEIKDIYRMQISESNSVAVNQYGTNLCKYKYDSLAVIEAKFAMAGGSKSAEPVYKEKEAAEGITQAEGKGEEFTYNQKQGPTQDTEDLGPTVVELYSQDDEMPKNSQEPQSQGEGVPRNNMEGSIRESVEQLSDNKNEAIGQELNLGCCKEKSPSIEQLGEGERMEEDPLQNSSPNWNSLIEEENAETETLPGYHGKGNEGETGQTKEQDKGEEEMIAEGTKIRKSDRILKQGLGGIKIADKAEIAIKKKNLEGNTITLKNSFAALDSLVLASKFSKMGGSTKTSNLEKFDLLKDLEIANHNLKERARSLEREPDKVIVEDLPLEEMKFIDWKSDTSNSSDLEGFQRVDRRKKKRNKKSRSPIVENKPKGSSTQPVVGAEPLEGEKSRSSTRYYLRRGVHSHYRNLK
jgi:hypothetical protein